VQLGYRLQTVAPQFIEGGRLADYSAGGDFMLGRDLSVSGSVQYEEWMFPVLSPTRQSDVTATVQFTYYPHWRIR
jgi:hypothetical protein